MKLNNRIAKHFPQSQQHANPNLPPVILHAATAQSLEPHFHKMPPEMKDAMASMPCSCCGAELVAHEPTFLQLREMAIRNQRKICVLCQTCTAEINNQIAAAQGD